MRYLLLLLSMCLLFSACHRTLPGQTVSLTRADSLIENHPDQFDYRKWIDIAMICLQTNQLDSAKSYLNRCSDPHEMAPTYYRLWQQVNKMEGHPSAALYYGEKVTIAKDSLNEITLRQDLARLKQKYDLERIIDENDRLIIVNQHNKTLLLLAVVVILILAVILLSFAYLTRQREVKRRGEVIAKEQENSRLIQQQVDLQQVIIEILKEYISTVADNSASDKSSAAKLPVKPGSAALTAQRREKIVDCIKTLYPSLYEFLTAHLSRLNPTEILLCCFIRSGFNASIIIPLLNIKETSFYTLRSRVREKLALCPEDNLADFLAKK